MSQKITYSTSFKTLEGRSKFLTNQCPITIERLSCVKCKDILVDPHQADCGCRFCLNCLKTGTKICPECRTNLTSQNGVAMNYDKAVEREILQLEIKCINDGCRYKCKIKDLDAHLAKCEYKKSDKIKCEDCGVEMLREDFYKSHRNVSGDNSLLCAKWSGVCPYKCSEDVRGNIKRHLSEYKNKPVECPMKDAGCCKVLRRGEMKAHIKEDVHEHMMMIQLTELQTANVRLRSEYEQSNAKLENEIRRLKDAAAEKTREMNKLKVQWKSEINIPHIEYTLSNVSNAIPYAKATQNATLCTIVDNESCPCYAIMIKVTLDSVGDRLLVSFKVVCTSMDYALYNEKIFFFKFKHGIVENVDCDSEIEFIPLELIHTENEMNIFVDIFSVPMLETKLLNF